MTVGTKCFLWMGEKKVGEFVCNSQSNQMFSAIQIAGLRIRLFLKIDFAVK